MPAQGVSLQKIKSQWSKTHWNSDWWSLQREISARYFNIQHCCCHCFL